MIKIQSTIGVELVRHTADDQSVADAARVSTLGARIGEDAPGLSIGGLINFLMRDRHGTPFEHNSMTFRVHAPIFVFREWHRHRVGWSYNEESGRYKELEPVFYMPARDRNLIQTGKPGAYTFEPGTPQMHSMTEDTMGDAYETAWEAYRLLLEDGVAREVARMVLPVGIYSTMYATCNARSLMHFLSLRTKDEMAKVPSFPQREIEMAAEQMEELWAELMPITHGYFIKHGRVAP